jgi:MOSC domain-containing protein YiiM
MGDRHFIKRYTHAARPGVYCRVIHGGSATAGEPVEFRPFEGARVTMPEMIATFGKRLSMKDRARFLSAPIHQKLRIILEAQT